MLDSSGTPAVARSCLGISFSGSMNGLRTTTADVRSAGVSTSSSVPSRKLLRIATRIGVGESTRFVRSHDGLLTRLFLRGRYGPGSLIERLTPLLGSPGNGIAGFHVYTFNELATTESWRREALRRLETVQAAELGRRT